MDSGHHDTTEACKLINPTVEQPDAGKYADCAQAAWTIYNMTELVMGKLKPPQRCVMLFRANIRRLSLMPGGEGERYSKLTIV